MISARKFPLFSAIVLVVLTGGCLDQTTDLKQKLAQLEKRVAVQEKGLAEFSGKFAPPKDFSADIQRLEDQQDRISQFIKTKVDPINMKLEEFRDWAQEAQTEQGKVTAKLKSLEETLTNITKGLETGVQGTARLGKTVTANRKKTRDNAKAVGGLSKGLDRLRKDLSTNNTKLLSAVKKTLPKIKKIVVAEIKVRLDLLEKRISTIKTGMESDRKTIDTIRSRPKAEPGKDVQALKKKINELEEIISAQKSFLLEIGSKVHELEKTVKGASAGPRIGPSRVSSR